MTQAIDWKAEMAKLDKCPFCGSRQGKSYVRGPVLGNPFWFVQWSCHRCHWETWAYRKTEAAAAKIVIARVKAAQHAYQAIAAISTKRPPMAKQPEPEPCPACGRMPEPVFCWGYYTAEHICRDGTFVRSSHRRTWPGAVNAWNRWVRAVKEKHDGI